MNGHLLEYSFSSKKIRYYLCLFSLMILSVMEGYGQDNNLTDLTNFTVTDHQDNGYVSFRILFYDDEDNDEWTTDGHLYANGTEIFKYWTSGQSEANWYWTYATLYQGTGEIQTRYGLSIINSQSSYEISRSGNTLTFISFDWYYPPEYEGVDMKFTLKATNENAEDLTLTQIGTAMGRTFSAPTLTEPILSSEVGKYQMTYNTSTEPIRICDNGNWKNSNATSGTLYTGIQDIKADYTFRAQYQLNKYYNSKENSVTKIIPAFHQAKDFKAEDADNGNTLLTWSIANTETNCQTGDQFEIQRANTPDYSSAKNVGTISFEAGKQNYSFPDETGAENVNGVQYYRIRRNKQPSWGWNLSQQCQIEKHVSHQVLAELKAKDVTEGEGLQAKVAWKLTDKDQNTVWTEGSKIIIRQVNVTNNNTTTCTYTLDKEDSQIKIDEDGYSYIIDDKIYATCMEYKYYAYVKPGNKNFANQTEIEADYGGNPIKPVSIGMVETLQVSKGYFSDRVDLSWETDGKPISRFAIQRRFYDAKVTDKDQGFTTISDGIVQGIDGQTGYQGKDETANPGEIYEYRILAQTDCAGEVKSNPSAIVRGFRSPTGMVSGKITFDYGDAVSGVVVRLDGVDIHSGSSLLFGGSAESYAVTKEKIALPENFLVQAFVKPTEANQTAVVVDAGVYRLGLKEGKPAFSANGGTSWVVCDTILGTSAFTQISGVYSTTGSWTLYVDTSKVVAENPATRSSLSDTKVTIGKGYKGYVDEIRLWNRALGRGDINQTFNRVLVGNENGLMAYWRLDDGVLDECYDISYYSSTYNAHHCTIVNATVGSASDEIPTSSQLALIGITGTDGVYTISGIPYKGVGSTYTLTPSYPNHSFNPKSSTVVIGGSATAVSGQDFKDNSAIKIEGYIFYENSTIPVPGVMFKINGQTVVNGSGEVIKSDKAGKFEFSVPTGSQKVQAVLTNHTFLNDGVLVNSDGTNLNYQQPLADIRFWDQTKVKLIGRVAGGTVQGNYPLGFSLSKNNLGDELKIVLSLKDDKTSYIVDSETPVETNEVHHNPKYANHVKMDKQTITISPNGETGEYVAYLYPVAYQVNEVSAKGYSTLFPNGTSMETIDLTNTFTEKESEYTDEKTGNTDRVTYNESYNRIYRAGTTLTFKQYEYGKEVDYFGDTEYTAQNVVGENENVSLYDKETKKYLFGYPIFHAATYQMRVSAHEDYYYNNDKNGTVDPVDVQGGEVMISNGFKTTSAPTTATLDENGKAVVSIDVDNVPFSLTGESALRTLDMSMTIDGANVQAPQIKAFLIGHKSKGKDFVTAGPIRLLNILRYPPGSNSYSYIEEGETMSYSYSTSTGKAHEGEESTSALLGASVITGVGVGAFAINETEFDNSVSAIVRQSAESSNSNATSYEIQMTSRYQTSDDPLYVGADGDVFVGTTNNVVYGPAFNIGIMPKKLYEASSASEAGGSLTVVAKTDDDEYYLVSNTALAVDTKFATLFAYPQVHIEQMLIPNIEKLRNSYLITNITEAEAQRRANNTGNFVYLSLLDSTDTDYGKDNVDARGNYIGTDKYNDSQYKPYLHYKVFAPEGGTAPTSGDTIFTLNQSIKEWVRVLTQNEREKLEAKDKVQNYSFQAGSPIEYSEAYSYVQDSAYTYSFMAGAGVATELGFSFNKAGMSVNVEELGFGTGGHEWNGTEQKDRTSGFVLADEGDTDYLSVDVYRVSNKSDEFNEKWTEGIQKNWEEKKNLGLISKQQYGTFIFRTRGGATSCPYEDKRVTKYYRPGTTLDEATMQIEKPVLMVDNPVISNIPSDQTAKYNLKMYTESETQSAGVYTLAIVDWQNQHGAKFSIDGVPLSDGRAIEVPFGDVLNKVLEVGRGTEYDYENLALVLKSQCQSDPNDFLADIADTVYISAHFIPSSSDINIKTPTDKWTLNTQSSLDSTSGKYYMPLSIDGFDVNFTGFDHIEIQYKPSSGSDKDWTNICSFFNDSVPYKAASGEKAMIEGATISTRFYGAEDQKYDIRAVTFSKVGNEFVTKSSPVISGVKDTKRPVVFGNIQPADGVLGIEDEIRLNFNEEIAEGYMTDVKNFQVTAVRNGSNGDHSTSLTFDGASSYLATQAERNLSNKDVSVEMWVLPSALGQKMTLFSHGTTTNSLELSIGADNSIQVSIGGKTYASKPQSFKTTDWAHVSMTYKASNRQLSAYFGGVEVIAGVQTTESNTSIGPMQFGRSVRGDSYFAGKMHEARVWNKVVSANNIMANKLTIYTGQEAGMLAYYPMNDGKGDRVTDKAQGATAWIYGADWSTLAGLSLSFRGDTVVGVNTSRLALTDEQDYTLEFWFKAAPGQKDAALVSNGKGIGDENNTNRNKVFVGFADNKLVFRNNGHEEVLSGKWDDDSWHHFAIAVNRNAGNAQVFLDGALNTYFDAGKLGGFSATSLYLGARRWTEAGQMVDHTDMYLKGQVDELRLWNMALPSTIFNKNYNVCPKGSEMGLMMYLPFSKYIRNSANVQEMVFSGEDLVTDSTLVTGGSRLASEEKAPVRAKGPEVSIPFTFVVNKDALVINLMDTPEALEKTTVNFTVKDVSDLNGNLMQSPVTWSAYINRNQLKWSETSVTKEKKLYAPMTFMVDVENQGGTEKNFTIEGLPAWLKADPEYGTIDPLGRQTILFTVDEGTNVGRYDEVVYVKGDNNVSEALPVTLKVFDQQPDWAVDPADFKYNMNIYGKLRVNKLFSTDAEDMIAVFDGGRCVGVANNQYADKNDMWYVFLTVYGNEIRGSEALSFRVWDASTGTVYDAYCDSPITFGSNSIVGTASTPVVFDAEERVVQNINLAEGWNWVSFNVKSDTPDMATILRNLMLVGDEQVKDEAGGTFAAYDKESGTWLGSDIAFGNKHMYLIQSSAAQKLSVSGIAIKEKEDLTIPVAAKWNYISYLPMTNLPIAEALSGYSAKEGDIIKSQNMFSMYGVKTGWLGSLTYMEPGKGYMLLNNGEGTSFAYPDMVGGNGLRSSGLQTRSGEAVTSGTTYTNTRFDANMSVVATVAESLPVYAGDKLQAYVGGELRGEALLTEDPYDGKPLYFVSIAGDRNEAVSFALERGGEIIAETSPMFDYRVNNVQGSIEQPVILDFVNDLQISVYPNPFERELNFVMNTEAGDKIGIYLYTMAGQMIHRHTETSVNGGYLHYRWECYEDLARTVYMAVVVVNGQKHAYKVKRK